MLHGRSTNRFATEDALLRRFAATRDPAVRDELVERFQRFAVAMARRYEGRGEPLEDLIQVANLGLVAAINRFDPEKGTPFPSFAAPTMLGELRRHFRDRVMPLRPPRSLQERITKVEGSIEELTSQLARSPTVEEVAGALELADEDVLEAMEAGSRRRVKSLDAPVAAGDGVAPIVETVGRVDPGYELVEDWQTVIELLPALSDDERAALRLRFVDGLTQSEIGKRLECSQMQVSRMLRRSLERLRAAYERSGPDVAGATRAAQDGVAGVLEPDSVRLGPATELL
jgi:RNA polymerase sigma-B factor